MNFKSRRGVLALIVGLAAAGQPTWGQEASWPDLALPPKAIGGGEKDAAVIVGAEKYAFVESVPGARENADAWHAYLTETLKVPAEKVSLLRDDDATNDEIRQAAAEKASQVEPGGTLWFVFIGHGAPSKDGKDGLLVGVDAQQKAESVYARSLSRNELLGILAKGKQDRTVVLIDACFSGKSSSGRNLVANLQPLLTMRSLPQGLDNRTILLTAARSDQFAGPLPKAEKLRPAFSYLALGALRGWAADASGQVTARGIVDYANKALSLAHDRTQTPELSAGAPGAVLGHGRERAPDLGKIDRESASSGSGFQVTELSAVPTAKAPQALASSSAGGLDFRSVDIEALKKYDAASELDKNGDVSPENKAASWRSLAAAAPKFADMARKRAAQWEAFAAQKQAADEAKHKRIEARDADWSKLSELLALGVVPESDKAAWSAEFLKAYWKSPQIEPAMAQGLLAYVSPGAMRESLKALAKRVSRQDAAKPVEPQAGTPSTEDAKALYILGTLVGPAQIKAYELTPVEMKSYLAGQRDAASGEKLSVDPEVYKPKLNEWLNRRLASIAERRKAGDKSFLDKAAETATERLPNGALYTRVSEGDGDRPTASSTVRVHYTGTFIGGKVFDSSVQRGQPAEFPLNGVIPCWTEGLQRMRVGGKGKLTCPSAMAYGDKGVGTSIPGGATLLFDVELLGIVK